MGFDFRRVRNRRGRWCPFFAPRAKSRTKLMQNLRDVFRKHVSRPVRSLIAAINPILRGWANHFRIGNSSTCFSYVRQWVVRKVRRHLLRAKNRRGHGWKRWSNEWLYGELGLYADYAIRYYHGTAARPTCSAT